jgi:hypothetical protein
MKGGLKILVWAIVVIACVAVWYGVGGFAPDLRAIIGGALGGVALVWGLKELIVEGVAEGVEKGIRALLANSDIVKNEISAAIVEANESSED